MKEVFKRLADLIALLAVLPAVACYGLASLAIGSRKAFPGWSQAMSLLPGLTGGYLRRAFYRCVLPRCGAGAWISFGTVLSHPTASIGSSVYVGPFCVLGDVTLEDDVLIGSHTSIINGSGQHGTSRLDVPVRLQPGAWPRVTVGRDTWIGDRVVVQADLGRQCVIGSGSVVTRPMPDFAVAAGVPAQIIRYRNQAEDAAGRSAAERHEGASSDGQEVAPADTEPAGQRDDAVGRPH